MKRMIAILLLMVSVVPAVDAQGRSRRGRRVNLYEELSKSASQIEDPTFEAIEAVQLSGEPENDTAWAFEEWCDRVTGSNGYRAPRETKTKEAFERIVRLLKRCTGKGEIFVLSLGQEDPLYRNRYLVTVGCKSANCGFVGIHYYTYWNK